MLKLTEAGMIDREPPANASAGGPPFPRNLPDRILRARLPEALPFSWVAFFVGFVAAAVIGSVLYLIFP
jgi:hypothetical protein